MKSAHSLEKGEISEKAKRRYLRWKRITRFTVLHTRLKAYDFQYEAKDLPEGANLILANHVTSDDQFFIGCLYNQHIHYVAGENAFRNDLFRKIATYTMGLIVHMRGVSAINTIKQMNRLLRKGRNVCIFPEGSTTFHARTVAVGDSIAKLAKMSGANLVLCRIDGGYFSKPRWAVSLRKGRVKIEEFLVTGEELKSMSVEEIAKLINDTLYVDAYADQEKEAIRYVGRDLCKGLESCIYQCPKCKQISKLHTTSSQLICDCGFVAEYDEYGYLNEENGSRYTISDLCDLQKEFLRDKVSEADETGESVLLFEDLVRCSSVTNNHKETLIGNIILKVYSDHVTAELGDRSRRIEPDEIENVFVYLRNKTNCVFGGKDEVYELQGDFSFNGLKYKDLIEIYKERG